MISQYLMDIMDHFICSETVHKYTIWECHSQPHILHQHTSENNIVGENVGEIS